MVTKSKSPSGPTDKNINGRKHNFATAGGWLEQDRNQDIWGIRVTRQRHLRFKVDCRPQEGTKAAETLQGIP